MITETDIEKEVQARLEFKRNELLTGLKNRAAVNWSIAFNSGSQKHTHYWEAFKELSEMIDKEWAIGTPHNDMAQQNKRKAKNKAVDKISERFLQGRLPYNDHINFVVSTIEEAQNY